MTFKRGSSIREDDFVARSGFEILDSDMHVFEPHDLYLKYTNPKWGDRIRRGEPGKKHGEIKFMFGDRRPLPRFPTGRVR